MNDLMPFELTSGNNSIIKVIGVGGGGSNAVNHMFEQGISDVDFIISNTDQQALNKSAVPIKIHLGQTLTQGLGAGNRPERGKEAAIENIEDVKNAFGENTKMIFITAGMGGGTGTGAAPVIAEAAKELGLLTVGIVTIPFMFEGKRRVEQAIKGVAEMSKHVDSLIVINNERLREIYGNLGIGEAFSRADDVLTVAAKGIADIITKEGHVNVDFADVNTVMQDSGVAIMGSAETEGEGRALKAIEEALNSPLLNNNDITGAKNMLLNISYGEDELTADELFEITNYAQEAAGKKADLIWGYNRDASLGGRLVVTIIATGFQTDIIPELYAQGLEKSQVVSNDISANANLITPVVRQGIKKGESIIFQDDTIVNKAPENKEEKKLEVDVKVPEKKHIPDDDSRVKIALDRLAIMDKSKNKRNINQRPFDYSKLEDIEEMEKVPAISRRHKEGRHDSPFKQKDVSTYTLDSDGDDINIKPNSFLHDNVD